MSMFKSLFKSGGDGSHESTSIIGALKKIDRDGDGQITENDLVLCCRDLHLPAAAEEQARSLFKKMDTNKNGRLDTKEAFGALKELYKLKKTLSGKSHAQ